MLRRFFRWLIGPPAPAENVPLPLEAQLAVLRTKVEELEQQWTDVQDWLHRWTARENARKRRAVKAAMGEGGEAPEAAGGEIVEPGANGAALLSRKGQLRQLAASLRR